MIAQGQGHFLVHWLKCKFVQTLSAHFLSEKVSCRGGAGGEATDLKNRKPGASGSRDDLCYEILSVSEDGLKCAVEVCDDILDILDTDGEADGVPLDALVSELGIIALCVGCRCRVYDERLHVGNIGQQ